MANSSNTLDYFLLSYLFAFLLTTFLSHIGCFQKKRTKNVHQVCLKQITRKLSPLKSVFKVCLNIASIKLEARPWGGSSILNPISFYSDCLDKDVKELCEHIADQDTLV
uniref:Uncharacterized protein n=1 Tax=Micrurus lemniscatus lemniscatus TaxID=129467 RepID=A0A2D4IDP1_MICLE